MLIGEDILQVRTPLVCFYALRGGDGLYLIDTGFFGARRALANALEEAGWREPVRGIILTHGHIDHIFNVAAMAGETGAWIAAPRADAPYLDGSYHYTGPARLCGVLEKAAKRLAGFRQFPVSRWLDDCSELPVWDGLAAVPLPGHTEGHTGFYCARRRLLFCGDLVASFRFGAQLPPAIFNSRPELIPASIARALALDLAGVLPNHGDQAPPAVHLERLRRLKMAIDGALGNC